MKIIQISDFHVTNKSTLDQYLPKISCLVDTVNREILPGELLIILVCGDIIDKGDPTGYPLAAEILKTIEKGLTNHQVQFEFTPGNHEINLNIDSKFDEFGNFLQNFDSNAHNISNHSVVVKNYGGINFVIMNSCYRFNTTHGEINLPELEEAIKSLSGPVVWVAHHTLFSRYDDDASSIRNSHALIEYILKNNPIAYIHGHTHGYSDITVGKKCKIIGVGPLFKPIADINNQFNILTITGTQLLAIDNYCYRADTNSFIKQTLYENHKINYFEGTSLPDLYAESVTNVKAASAINNLCLDLSCEIKTFLEDVEGLFPREIDLAKLWIEDKLPDSMYYNHAQYMNKGSKRGMDYILSELSNKSTSSRAIIPLINMADVVDSGDGHLPSLDIIQFGFDNESRSRLYLTVYLRALEVNHFLKINICEMYHLIKMVQDTFRSAKWLNLNIIAFRAQYKENFGCFMKAKIDSITPYKLTAIVMKKEIPLLIDMLMEKRGLAETVVNATGIESFAAALLETKDGEKFDVYTEDLINKSQHLASLYKNLGEARRRTSLHAEIEIIEHKIASYLDNIVKLLREIKEKQ